MRFGDRFVLPFPIMGLAVLTLALAACEGVAYHYGDHPHTWQRGEWEGTVVQVAFAAEEGGEEFNYLALDMPEVTVKTTRTWERYATAWVPREWKRRARPPLLADMHDRLIADDRLVPGTRVRVTGSLGPGAPPIDPRIAPATDTVRYLRRVEFFPMPPVGELEDIFAASPDDIDFDKVGALKRQIYWWREMRIRVADIEELSK